MNKVEKKQAERTVHCGRNDSIILDRKNHLEEERQGRQMCPVCQELSDYAETQKS